MCQQRRRRPARNFSGQPIVLRFTAADSFQNWSKARMQKTVQNKAAGLVGGNGTLCPHSLWQTLIKLTKLCSLATIRTQTRSLDDCSELRSTNIGYFCVTAGRDDRLGKFGRNGWEFGVTAPPDGDITQVSLLLWIIPEMTLRYWPVCMTLLAWQKSSLTASVSLCLDTQSYFQCAGTIFVIVILW